MDHNKAKEFGLPGLYPVLPLRNVVVFPHMVIPLFVGREKSIKALEDVIDSERTILLLTQKTANEDEPTTDGLYTIGTIAKILQLLKLPDGTVKVLVEGISRAQVLSFTDREDFFEANAQILEETTTEGVEMEALTRSLISDFDTYAKTHKKISSESIAAISKLADAAQLADAIAAQLGTKVSDKQSLLEEVNIFARMERELALIESEMSILQVEKKIRSRVKKQMEKAQRDYYLNEQMRAIQKELGESSGEKDELTELEEKIQKTKLSSEAREKSKAELNKLKQMSPMSAEATVVRNYLDCMLSLPWGKNTKIKPNLEAAQTLLDLEHHGLEKIKERIIEYLAVQIRTNQLKGQILCLVGPPGVGKTSLAKSIAKATGREFARIPLGGVRDEAEIRGHRRTYIGSMPGKILQALRKTKKNNPLILLDEIDKMGMDFRGDPAAALLEVLDPEQNQFFMDHYLEVEYDLSKVMFIATANTLDIPPALMDRLEILRIAGYTEEEKIQIAKKHLIPKAMQNHGLISKEFNITDDAIISTIRKYTKEAGVRSLERRIGALARKVTKDIVTKKHKSVEVTPDLLEPYLGVPRHNEQDLEREEQIGIVTGMAWTEVGGELLTIEAVPMPGKGKMTVTGNLKDVMKESISAAASYVRSKAIEFGIEPPLFDRKDVHVHVPEGATPKDGPSAGIAMAVAIISAMTGIPVSKDVAMTGEITLRGRVLAIGGLKEKLLAALRGRIQKVLIPEANLKDLADIPETVKSTIEIIPVAHMSTVLQHALSRVPIPIAWEEAAVNATQVVNNTNENEDPIFTAH